MRRKRDGVRCCEAEITTVFMNLDTKKPEPITDELRTIFARFLKAGE